MKNLFLLLLFLVFVKSANAQMNYQPSKENLEAREWFQDAKFGLFIHWGVYSILADGEWVMQVKQIPVSQYENLPAFFNPVDFNPAEWVKMAKDAGMKYITITSKHHDGFAMYDSKISDYDIADRSPYAKDVLKMLKDECDKQGIKLFFYYSQLDWHHPDYFPRGRTGADYTGREEGGDWNKYIDYMNTQLTELLTNYGTVGGIWFDGMWDKPEANWRLEETYTLIHKLQPNALVGSNHHRAPINGEDFQMFEQDLPGKNTAGHSRESVIGNLPLETCQTINRSWGFNLKDTKYKSAKELIQFLVKAAGNNANLLLNTGPMPNGKIIPENVKTLQEMGKWLEIYGESIYGTRGGPVSQRLWGVTTQKENKIFVHILDWQEKILVLPTLQQKIKKAYLFKDNGPVTFKQDDSGAFLTLPEMNDEVDLVVVLEI